LMMMDPATRNRTPPISENNIHCKTKQSVFSRTHKSPFLVANIYSTITSNNWIKIDQLDVTCFIISLFTAQHVSNVNTSIFRKLRLIVDLFHVLYCSGSMCVGVTVWFGWVVWSKPHRNTNTHRTRAIQHMK
jgi:hypothetical protein